MSLRRQYSLPNCTLTLDGFSGEGRSVLDIVASVDCQFMGMTQRLQGGKALLEHLIQAVSPYAQSQLSEIPPIPTPPQTGEDTITLEPNPETQSHRLIWYPASSAYPTTEVSSEPNASEPTVLELSTVQLFDLMEAIDQLLLDQQTLPDLSLSLQPVPRRFRPPDEPLAQRLIPASIGLASLAIAALVIHQLPIPSVRKPDPNPQATPTDVTPQPTPTSAPPPTP
jgi:hypothetical protein